MSRVYIFLCSLFFCISVMNHLAALEFNDKQNNSNDLRILDLLPNLLCPLAVEPGIPSDFVALTPTGNVDLYDWIYWGPKDVLNAYFENPSSLKRPILRVKLSENVCQTGPHSFNTGSMEFTNMLKKEDPKGFGFIRDQWGDYPILAIKATIQGQLLCIAWVGLNDPSGFTLVFNLVCPNKIDNPKGRLLWDNLVTKTTQLNDRDLFKVFGQDLQEGYTLVNVGGAKLKMFAEKRESDGLLQVVVIPESPNVEFHYSDMIEGAMGSKWKYGEPMVKIYGEIVITEEKCKSSINHITSILIKNVSEFSFKNEDGKKLLIFQKNCDQVHYLY